MSAQDDVVTAARALRDQGNTPFSAHDLLSTARRYGSTFPDVDLKKALDALIARADDPAQEHDVFVEVRKGWYRLRR